MSPKDFLDVLFDNGEHTCFTDKMGTRVSPISEDIPPGSLFFAINPLHPTTDHKPTPDTWHRSNLPRRADANVTAFRNILVEIDNLPVAIQREYIGALGLPYSTATYSGNKSIHYILSLATPLEDIDVYKALVARVYKACQIGTKAIADPSCKNPSRLSRLPEVIRPDTGKLQELLYVGARVPNAKLELWLNEKGAPLEAPRPPKPILKAVNSGGNYMLLSGETKNLLMLGADQHVGGDKQRQIVKAALDMIRCGFEFNEIFDKLSETDAVLSSTRTEMDLERIIDWAFDKVQTDAVINAKLGGRHV